MAMGYFWGRDRNVVRHLHFHTDRISCHGKKKLKYCKTRNFPEVPRDDTGIYLGKGSKTNNVKGVAWVGGGGCPGVPVTPAL